MAVVAAPFLLRQPLTGLLHSPSSRSLAPPSSSRHRRRSRQTWPPPLPGTFLLHLPRSRRRGRLRGAPAVRPLAASASRSPVAARGATSTPLSPSRTRSGTPIRASASCSWAPGPAWRASPSLPPASRSAGSTAQVVLVLGGSSGAHAINITVLNMYSQMLSGHKNRFIIWQTGEDNFNEMESLVKTHRRLFLTPFLHTMDLAYAAADVVVSRAGAMTCTEILTTGKPSILIPSPNVAEDHQTKNANIMADIAGSNVLTEDELDSSTLEVAIDEILGDESLMAEMSEKAMKSAMPNASTDIARIIIALSESFSGKQGKDAMDVQNDATAAKPLVHDP